MFVRCNDGSRWVNLAHVMVVNQLDFPDQEGVARFELLAPDRSFLGVCLAGSVEDIIAEAVP